MNHTDFGSLFRQKCITQKQRLVSKPKQVESSTHQVDEEVYCSCVSKKDSSIPCHSCDKCSVTICLRLTSRNNAVCCVCLIKSTKTNTESRSKSTERSRSPLCHRSRSSSRHQCCCSNSKSVKHHSRCGKPRSIPDSCSSTNSDSTYSSHVDEEGDTFPSRCRKRARSVSSDLVVEAKRQQNTSDTGRRSRLVVNYNDNDDFIPYHCVDDKENEKVMILLWVVHNCDSNLVLFLQPT